MSHEDCTWAVVSLLLLSSALAGCIHTNDPDEVEIIDEQTNNAYSIVAPIDTGINVYHNHFVLQDSTRMDVGWSRCNHVV